MESSKVMVVFELANKISKILMQCWVLLKKFIILVIFKEVEYY